MNALDKLVRMANQIAGFFQSYPNEEAAAGIAKHVVDFWTPKMRLQLAERLAGSTEGVHPLVVEALGRWPAGGPGPANRASAGPAQAGELGASDAG